MRVALSLGGSVVFDELSADQISQYATMIDQLVEADFELAVIVGGGPAAREYIETGRNLGTDEARLDEVGIDVTRLNARLLIEAMDDHAYPWPPESYAEAGQALRQGDVPVLGGIAPAQTTDAVSAATAEYIDADLLVFATSIDGVYSGDPATDSAAERYDSLHVDELLEIVSPVELSAGSKSPVDLLAAKIIQRARLHTVVLDGSDPAAIATAIETGEHDGTDILIEGATRPPAW